jgi:hypothetical protein
MSSAPRVDVLDADESVVLCDRAAGCRDATAYVTHPRKLVQALRAGKPAR